MRSRWGLGPVIGRACLSRQGEGERRPIDSSEIRRDRPKSVQASQPKKFPEIGDLALAQKTILSENTSVSRTADEAKSAVQDCSNPIDWLRLARGLGGRDWVRFASMWGRSLRLDADHEQ